jgi:hypothetical protein
LGKSIAEQRKKPPLPAASSHLSIIGQAQQGHKDARDKRPFWFVLRKLPYRRPLLRPT